MSKHWFVVIIILILQSFLYADTPAPKDPNLNKPVTLAVKGESLSDILPMLEKQTSVKLRVVKAIAEQKATIFVDKKPLIDVMHGLETLFGYKWLLNNHHVYELCEPKKVNLEKKNARKALGDAIWNQLDAESKKYKQFFPKDEIEIHAATKDAAENFERGISGENKHQLAIRAAWAKMLLRTTPNVRIALTDGAMVWFGTETDESEWKMPLDITRVLASDAGLIRDKNGNPVISPDDDAINMNLGIKCDISENNGKIRASMTAYYRYQRIPQKANGKEPMTCHRFLESSPVLLDINDHAIPDRFPHKQDDALYRRAVDITSDELFNEAGGAAYKTINESVMVNRSDVLSLLHKKMGLQILADHYSNWFPINLANSDKSLAGWIRLVENSQTSPRAYWGWDGDFIYIRTKNTPMWNQLEIKNSLLHSWSATYKEQGWLNLDQLAQMALLSDNQLQSLGRNGLYMRIGTEKDMVAWRVHFMINELRLYALLSSKQKKKAIRNGVKVVGFTSEQLCLSMQCTDADLGRGMMENKNHPNRYRVGIWKNSVRIDRPQIHTDADPILLQINDKVINSNLNSMVAYEPPYDDLKDYNKASKIQRSGYTLVFHFADGFKIERGILIDPSKKISVSSQ